MDTTKIFTEEDEAQSQSAGLIHNKQLTTTVLGTAWSHLEFDLKHPARDSWPRKRQVQPGGGWGDGGVEDGATKPQFHHPHIHPHTAGGPLRAQAHLTPATVRRTPTCSTNINQSPRHAADGLYTRNHDVALSHPECGAPRCSPTPPL